MSKKRGTKKGEVSDVKKQLHALLLADSFDVFHRPLSLEQPRTLFSLVNVPLIEYTLEFLASSGVEKVFVFCCAHADKIQEYIKQSQWNSNSELQIHVVIRGVGDMTAGEAMREMYTMGSLRDDFVLVFGDVVANFDLRPVLETHLERKKKDKECIYTAVFKEAPAGHRTRSLHDDVIVAINQQTNEMLTFDKGLKTRHVELNSRRLGPHEHASVQFRYDLIDCGIAICSPEVLYQFQDNFDYATLASFLSGTVRGEILGAKAHAYIIKGQYAARVNCFRTYKAISNDIINRWTFPVVPDSNLFNTSYRLSRNAVYKEKSIVLSHSCVIEEKTVIGEGTTIGANTLITTSTIGRSTKIGNNVKIKGAIIWDNVTIADNVIIEDSLLAYGVQVLSDVHIKKGCVISNGVIIGKNCVLAPFTKLTLVKHHETDTISLGEGGIGRVWSADKNTKKILGEKKSEEKYIKLNKLVASSTELVPTDFEIENQNIESDETDSEDEEEKQPVIYESARARLMREVLESVIRAETEGTVETNRETVLIEFRALKMSENVTFLDLVEYILYAVIDTSPDMSAYKKSIEKWTPIIDKFLDSPTRKNDGVELIFKLEDYIAGSAKHRQNFGKIIKELYENGLMEGDAFLSWAEQDKEDDDEEGVEDIYSSMKKQIEPFLSWLKQTSKSVIKTAKTDETKPVDTTKPAETKKKEEKDESTSEEEPTGVEKSKGWAEFLDSDEEKESDEDKDEKESDEEKESEEGKESDEEKKGSFSNDSESSSFEEDSF